MNSTIMPMPYRAARQPPFASNDPQIPLELQALASAHELEELHRYRQLAFAFLTFDTATSRLMAALGIECELRLETLDERSAEPNHRSPYRLHKHMASRRDAPRRATIDTLAPAREALIQAAADAKASCHFYATLSDNCTVAALYPMLKAIVRQKQAELQVLEEHRIRSDACPP
nr:hypothetical protein [Halomonas sp. 1513]